MKVECGGWLPICTPPATRIGKADLMICLRFLFVSLLLLAPAAFAAEQNAIDEDDGGSLTLTFENDIFAVTDRNYSNGVKLSYTAPRNDVPGFIGRGIDRLGLLEDGRDWYSTYEFGQRIFTPTDIAARIPDPADHPYAGHAYLSYALSAVEPTRLQSLRLEIGLTGEASLAEQTQKLVHSIVGAQRPNGWGSQLRSAPTIGLSYEIVEKRGKEWDLGETGLLRAEVLPRATVALGTFDTYAGIGSGVRIGQNYGQDFGAAHIRPGTVGSDIFIPAEGFGWSLFAGIDARLVGRSGAIQGPIFAKDGAVTPNRLVADASFGLTLSYDGYELSYAHVIRSETFRNQDGTHQFGAVNLRIKF